MGVDEGQRKRTPVPTPYPRPCPRRRRCDDPGVDVDASSLTPLKVGDRVTVAVFPDDGGGTALVLPGRVAYIELHPGQVGVPWAEYLDGDPPSIVLSWENWLDGIDESHEAQTLTVWIGYERIWIVPADLDDA